MAYRIEIKGLSPPIPRPMRFIVSRWASMPSTFEKPLKSISWINNDFWEIKNSYLSMREDEILYVKREKDNIFIEATIFLLFSHTAKEQNVPYSHSFYEILIIFRSLLLSHHPPLCCQMSHTGKSV